MPRATPACSAPARRAFCTARAAASHASANATPTVELCGTGVDESCDGTIDEADCELCLPADTILLPTQTKRSVLRLKVNDGRVITKGQFELPPSVTLAPATEPVTLRVRDAGGDYIVTIPAGGFVGSSNGRSFKFRDTSAPYENGGMQKARLKLASDLHTVRYSFKAKGLTLPAFAAGPGSLHGEGRFTLLHRLRPHLHPERVWLEDVV